MTDEEWDKCENDIVYFVENYITTIDDGRIKYKLFDFQKEILNDNQNKNINYVGEMSRQMGSSTILCCLVIYHLIFTNKDITYLTLNQHNGKDAVSKIKNIVRFLPDDISKDFVFTKNSVEALNGKCEVKSYKQIDGMNSNDKPKLIISDLIMFSGNVLENFIRINSVKNSNFIILTGKRKREDAETLQNLPGTYSYKKFPWNVHPYRTEEWKEKVIQDIGEELFKLEFE